MGLWLFARHRLACLFPRACSQSLIDGAPRAREASDLALTEKGREGEKWLHSWSAPGCRQRRLGDKARRKGSTGRAVSLTAAGVRVALRLLVAGDKRLDLVGTPVPMKEAGKKITRGQISVVSSGSINDSLLQLLL